MGKDGREWLTETKKGEEGGTEGVHLRRKRREEKGRTGGRESGGIEEVRSKRR